MLLSVMNVVMNEQSDKKEVTKDKIRRKKFLGGLEGGSGEGGVEWSRRRKLWGGLEGGRGGVEAR